VHDSIHFCHTCGCAPCRDAWERRHCPLPFKRGATEAEVPFHNSIGNFMVYQDRLETNLLQLFTHPENSEWFYIISVVIYDFPLPITLLLRPPLLRRPCIPDLHNTVYLQIFKAGVLLSKETFRLVFNESPGYDFILLGKICPRHLQTRATNVWVLAQSDQSPFH